MRKTNIGNIDLNELKNKFSEIKEAAEKAKSEDNKNEVKLKQSLGSKILGIVAIIILVVGCGWAIFSSLDMLLLPKNSIKIVITDESGKIFKGVKVNVSNNSVGFDQDFEVESDIIIFGAKPGRYQIVFESIPENHVCDNTDNSFELEKDGKVEVEYKCRKIEFK